MRMTCLDALLYGGLGLRAADKEPPAGFASLFNGKDLRGWKVNEGGKLDRWGPRTGCSLPRKREAAGP
jgi:hypothetical protein